MVKETSLPITVDVYEILDSPFSITADQAKQLVEYLLELPYLEKTIALNFEKIVKIDFAFYQNLLNLYYNTSLSRQEILFLNIDRTQEANLSRLYNAVTF